MTTRKKKGKDAGGTGTGGGFIKKVSSLFNLDSVIIISHIPLYTKSMLDLTFAAGDVHAYEAAVNNFIDFAAIYMSSTFTLMIT